MEPHMLPVPCMLLMPYGQALALHKLFYVSFCLSWQFVLQTAILSCRVSCVYSGPIRYRSAIKSTILDVMKSKKDWVETDSETDWDFFWADKG